MSALSGKVSIVTGSATDIGKAIAQRFAAAGARVVIDYVGKDCVASASATEEAITRAGGEYLGVSADVSDPAQAQDLVARAVAKFGKLDIVVNNAGVETKSKFVDYPLEAARKIMNVNFFGTFLVAQAAAKQMMKQGAGGRIINISSIHEDLPMPENAIYCASKGAIRMLMRTMAVELAPHGITVNNIEPDAIYTPIDADIEVKPEIEKKLVAEIPLGRWGKPHEIGDLAVFLASDAASYITGSTYFIDGGMLRHAGAY